MKAKENKALEARSLRCLSLFGNNWGNIGERFWMALEWC
jgi:hypothetical protein